MAARLIQRASRLLAVPITFPPSSTSVPSECVRLRQLSPSFPCQVAPLHCSSLCRLPETLPETSNMSSLKETEFFKMLVGIQEVEELLNIACNSVTPNRGAMIINQISIITKKNNTQFIEDYRFRKLLDDVNSQIQHISHGHLLKLLRSMNILEFDSKNHYLLSVVTELRWRVRKLSMRFLGLLSIYVNLQPRSQEECMLIDELVKQVELRWIEITDTRTLATLVSKLGFMSNSLMERLEDKVLEYADQFTPADSRKVIVALSNLNRRTLPVLQALSSYLVKPGEELTPPIILDLAYSFARLNFNNPQTLQKLAADVIPNLGKMSPPQISSLINSFAMLKTCPVLLCEAVAQLCLEGIFRTNYLCNLLVGFAQLNLHLRQDEEVFKAIHKILRSDLDSLNWQQQLSVVWALCILGRATSSYFQRVLVPEFYNQVLEDNSTKSMSYCMKLMQINTTALLESPEYSSPLLPDNVLEALQKKCQARKNARRQDDIVEVLKKVFPDAETTNYNVNLVYGWSIDAEVVLDSEYNPLPLKNFVGSHNLHSLGTQPLAEGVKRFAIVTLGFSHFIFHKKDLLGPFAMCRRQLRAAGFLVVEVPYYDWDELKTDWQKENYLKTQISKTVAEEMAQ